MNTQKRIHVVAAVIRDSAAKILIAKRPDHLHQGGLWEFPGGKVEPDELPESGLKRELREELGIRVRVAKPYMAISHDYVDKHILLDVWEVTDYEGQARGLEGQEIVWVTRDELDAYVFPEANFPIIEKIRSCQAIGR